MPDKPEGARIDGPEDFLRPKGTPQLLARLASLNLAEPTPIALSTAFEWAPGGAEGEDIPTEVAKGEPRAD